jgi:hypothetical protein
LELFCVKTGPQSHHMRRHGQLRRPLRHDAINLPTYGIARHGPFRPALGDDRTDLTITGRTGQSPVQRKMWRFRGNARGHDRLKVGPGFESFHGQAVQWIGPVLGLDRQTLAAFGATCVDHCTAATGLHANQKAMGAGSAGLGGLVSAFHRSSNLERPLNNKGNPKLSQIFGPLDSRVFFAV